MPHRRLHRWVFFAAGIYNLIWGLLAGLAPDRFFDVMGIARLNHPSIFACLGMVIGVYGLLYLEVVQA